MSLITWSDDLSVSIGEIDDQHKKLIGLINNLHDAMKSGQAKNVMEKTLGDLADYAVYHFRTEEQYMEKFHYPEYQTHKLAHTAFVKKVTQFQADFKAGKLGISMDLMNFLREWLTTHIRGTDRNYSATFRKGGVR